MEHNLLFSESKNKFGYGRQTYEEDSPLVLDLQNKVETLYNELQQAKQVNQAQDEYFEKILSVCFTFLFCPT